jgi:hypothetical protein
MTAVAPALQAVLLAVALLPHLTDTVELLPFAVTANVPDPLGPVSQISEIVSGPAAGTGVGVGVGDGVAVVVTVVANAVDEIAMTAPPATTAASADFKIDIMTLLTLTVTVVSVPTLQRSPVRSLTTFAVQQRVVGASLHVAGGRSSLDTGEDPR